jgi:NDP-sugar pyrophosphorylase family protein
MRLAPATEKTPKCLLRVRGVPIAEGLVRRLAAAGAREVFLLAHHLAEALERHFAAAALPVPVEVVREPSPLGTIGGLRLLPPGEGTTLVANGDLVTALDFAAMLRAHRLRGADLTIATHEERVRLTLGEVLADEGGRVTEYLEKPAKRFAISSGVYLLEPRALALLRSGERADFPDLVRRAISGRLLVLAHRDDAFWIDVNTLEDLATASEQAQRDPSLLGLPA